MEYKARTIQLTDLSNAIDEAVKASAGKELSGGTIIGRIAPQSLAENVDVFLSISDIPIAI